MHVLSLAGAMFEPIHGLMVLYFITVLGLRWFPLDKDIKKKGKKRKSGMHWKSRLDTERKGKDKMGWDGMDWEGGV